MNIDNTGLSATTENQTIYSNLKPASLKTQDVFITWLLDHIDFQNCWIAGSAAYTLFISGTFDNSSDIDVFFNSTKSYLEFKSLLDHNPYCKYMGTSGDKPIDNYGGVAEIWQIESVYHEFKYELNLIGFNYHIDPLTCIHNFDFTVTQFATDGIRFCTTEQSLLDVENNVLRFVDLVKTKNNKSWDLIHARLTKYINKGFNTDEEATLYILENI